MADTQTPHVCIDRILRVDELARRDIGPLGGTDPQTGAQRRRQEMAVLKDARWTPGRTITIAFTDGHPVVKERVKAIALEWLEVVNLDFQFIDDPTDANIRISFEQRGSWSYLGNRCLEIHTSLPTMNYGWLEPDLSDEAFRRVVLHEFGHALGAVHEHSNPNADIPWDVQAVLDYYMGPPNNWDRDQVEFNVLDAYSADLTNHTEFDDESIMLYPIPAEHLTDTTRAVPWRNSELSDLDRELMTSLYPGAAGDVPLGIGAPLDAAIGAAGEADRYLIDLTNQAGLALYQLGTEGSTDVMITLFGPDDLDRRLAFDDDSGRGLNPQIVTTLGPGRYLAVVRHFSPNATGNYRIRLDRLG